MPRNHTKPVDVAERRVRAVELRKAGNSYRDIAETLGVDVATAHKYVKDAMAELAEMQKDAATELHQMECERLSRLMAQCEKVIDSCDADPDSDPELRLRAVDRLTKLSAEYRKLNGLDKPQVIEGDEGGGGIAIYVNPAGRRDD